MNSILPPILFLNVVLAATSFAYPQMNSPVHACTFYKSIWGPHFMNCAEPTVEASSCKKVKYIGYQRIEYQGDYVSMYLPDFVIETTEHWGKSMFSDSSPAMKEHLEMAKSWYERDGTIAGLAPDATDKGGESFGGRFNFWHARLLPVPYGGFNTYPDVAGAAGGHVLPVCYSGISEYYPDQWNLGLSDLKFAMNWAPIGIPMCHTNLGIISNAALHMAREAAKQTANSFLAEFGMPIDVSDFSFQASCANPVQAQVGITEHGADLK